MTAEQCFLEYALAFELTYQDDDWTRLEPFFAEDATYEVRNSPFDCSITGRAAILAGLKKSIDGFDRRLAGRRVEMTGPPATTGDTVTVPWAATYDQAGAPELRFEGRTTATVVSGRITQLVDEYPEGEREQMTAWAAAHAPEIDGAYV